MNKDQIRQIKDYDLMLKEEARKGEKIKLSCDHRRQNGRPDVDPTEEDGVVRCNICGEKISLRRMNGDKLENAASVLTDAIQSLKLTDTEISRKMLERLAEAILTITTIPRYYNKVFNTYVNNNRRRDNDEEDYSERFRNRPEFFINQKIYGGGKKRRFNDDDGYDRYDRNDRRRRDFDDDDDDEF